MPPIAAPARPQMAVPHRKFSEVLLVVLLAAPLLAIALALSRSPRHVPVVTIRNPAEHRLNVVLAGDRDQRGLPLGNVDRGTYLTVGEVLDMGGTWVFRFNYGGVQAAEVRLTRDELAAADWTVTVPDGADGPLEAVGLGPTPAPSPDNPQGL